MSSKRTFRAGLLILVLGGVTFAQTARYRRQGPVYLNDIRATPGAVLKVDLKTLCTPGYTATVRDVPLTVKKQACDLYGVPAAHCNGREVEIDHLISLEIGGSNDLKNLWPQPYKPIPGAHEKDKLENWLHSQVCSGNMSLQTAQRGIAKNWYRGYASLVQSLH
jgi:hypothetical protein